MHLLMLGFELNAWMDLGLSEGGSDDPKRPRDGGAGMKSR